MISLVIDESLSMLPWKGKVKELISRVSADKIVVFSDQAKEIHDAKSYNPHGNTALWDGLRLGFAGKPQLLICLTDGENNRSYYWKEIDVINAIPSVPTVVFLVPPGKKANLIARFGIPADNIFEWSNAFPLEEIVAGLERYEKSGRARTETFFTDVSGDPTRDLEDLTKQFRVLSVDSDTRIDAFVETRTKKAYIPGSAYYQLMKREKIQGNKAVLVMDRKTRRIYGGAEARSLIGLGSIDRMVKPGDHGGFDIFVQSRSINRRLFPGTRVLLDKTKKRAEKLTYQPC